MSCTNFRPHHNNILPTCQPHQTFSGKPHFGIQGPNSNKKYGHLKGTFSAKMSVFQPEKPTFYCPSHPFF
jgi:hypothetical protein